MNLVLAGLAVASLVTTPHQEAKAAGGEKLALRLQIKKGDRFAYRSRTDIDQAMKLGEMDMSTKLHIEKDFTYLVEEVAADGSAWLLVEVASIRGKLAAPMMGEIVFDSTKPDEDDNPMIAMAIKPITALGGKSFRMRVGADGRVAEVRGAAEIMKAAMPGEPPGGEPGKKLVAKMLSDEEVAKTMQGSLVVFSDAPTGIGENWKHESDLPASSSGVAVAIRGSSSIEKAEGDAVSVATSGTLSQSESPEPGSDPAREVRVESGEVRRTAKVSRKDGLPVEMSTEMRMESSIPNPMGGGGDGARLKSTQTMRSTLERTALPAAAPGGAASAPAKNG